MLKITGQRLKHESRQKILSKSKRKREEGKSSFLKGCYAGFSGLPTHFPGLGTVIDCAGLHPLRLGLAMRDPVILNVASTF